MLKKILLLSIVLLSYTLCADHSGVKFGIDTNVVKLLQKMNLNRFMQNKTLIPEFGLNISRTGLLSYKLHVSNLSVSDIKNPIVDVSSRSEGNNQYLHISIQKLEILLNSSFNIEVFKIFKDQLIQSPIHIILNQIDSEFYFSEGNVKFSKFEVKIGNIDLQFNNFFYKMIYKIAKGLIISKINSVVSSLHSTIESELNNFITSQMLFDVGMGIGINATNVDRPELISIKKLNKQKLNKIVNEKILEFLGEEPKHLKQNAENESSILEFGVHGSLYPNMAPDVHPNIESAAEMEYIAKTFQNDITLLISDYTLNSLLFMVQQTGGLKYSFTNDTNSLLPFNLDTESLNKFIPGLSYKYPENKLSEIKIYINAINHLQPLINTDDDGSTFTFNFGFDLNVFNSTEPWDDPEKELSLNLTMHAKLQYLVTDGKIDIICFRTVLDDLNKISDGLNVPEDVLKKSLDGLFNDLLKLYKPSLSNIDILGKFAGFFNIQLDNLIVLTEQKYLGLSVNIKDF